VQGIAQIEYLSLPLNHLKVSPDKHSPCANLKTRLQIIGNNLTVSRSRIFLPLNPTPALKEGLKSQVGGECNCWGRIMDGELSKNVLGLNEKEPGAGRNARFRLKDIH